MTSVREIASYLDDLLSSSTTPDYPNALNGLQLENSGRVSKVAAAVDYSLDTVTKTAEAKADLLLLHHGMFWSGVRPIVAAQRTKLETLIRGDIAVYSSHIPLDKHPVFGNNVLLSRALDLTPSGQFAMFKGVAIGLSGDDEIKTEDLLDRARKFAQGHGGDAVASGRDVSGAVTRRWAMCTGAGASSETLTEAAAAGIDTLIVGEGPHHTAVEASDLGITVIYTGHYATETLGVRALASHLSERFDLEYVLIDSPTRL